MTGIEREKVGPLPIWGWAVGCGLLVWLLYVVTLAPTTGFWDTSEYIATAQILGLPHPPGNPLFVLIGRVWIVLLSWTGLSVAMRINLVSATMSAATAVLWFLAIARVWAHFTKDRRLILVACFAARLSEPHPYEPQLAEVSEVFEVPYAAFLEKKRWSTRATTHPRARFKSVPYFDYEDHTIWGLTGIILRDFVRIAGEFDPTPEA